MTKRYDKVMEKIQVTDAMRRRILANIGKLDLEAAPAPKTVSFPSVKRLMPLAACFVLLLAGVFWGRYQMPGGTVDPLPSDIVTAVNNIEEVADAEALSEMVGFPAKELHDLPFQPDQVTYTSFWQELAQISYTGEGNTAVFRQSLGEEDRSGDYTVYAETVVQEIGGLSVTLKGEAPTYSLAVWSDGTYAYSVSAEPALTLSEWETVITGIE